MTVRSTLAIALALACLLSVPAGAHAGSGGELYKAKPGPHAVASDGSVVLRDDRREKDLQVRVSWPESRGPFPVIVWSHGATGTKDMYGPIVEHWVGHGYVCIQANHSDSRALGDRGRIDVFRDWDSRPRDVSFLLDSLGALERKVEGLRGKMDRSICGVGGHSFGAHTAQLVGGVTTVDPLSRERTSHADARPRAFLLISPQGKGPMLDEESWTTLLRPTMTVTGSKDLGRQGQPYTWRLDPFRYAPSQDKILVDIEGAHHGFGGIVGEGEFRHAGPADPDQVRLVKSATIAFWDVHLRGSREARAFLDGDALERWSEGKAKVTHGEPDAEEAPPARPPRAEPFADVTWTDETRERDVPVRIYAPAPERGDGPFPAVVFSHGGGESREAYGYLGRSWAGSGYVAVFVTHEGNDAGAVRKGGMRALGQADFANRPADLGFVIDRLLSPDLSHPLLRGRIDPRRIAVAGQCAGSTTALALAGLTSRDPRGRVRGYRDDRIRATIALGPQPGNLRASGRRESLHEASWSTVDGPVLVMTGRDDFGWMPDVRADPTVLRKPYDRIASENRFLVEIEGARHHAFTDSDPYYPAGKRDPRHHGWIARATTAFLDAFLKEDGRALAWLESEALEKETDGACRQEHGRRRAADGPLETGCVERISLVDRERDIALPIRIWYPKADGPFPVIVYCHAAGGRAKRYDRLASYWAGQGYVCILPDHADSPDAGGRQEPRSAVRNWTSRPLDARLVLDHLETLDSVLPHLAGRLDRDRIGVGGHYVGSLAAGLLTGMRGFPGAKDRDFTDARVRAALMMSPVGRGQGLTEATWAEMRRPLMVLTGSRDASRRTGNPAEWRKDPFRFCPPGDKFLVEIEDYGATPGLREAPPSSAIWPPAVEELVRAATLAFWDATLKADGAALETLRAGRLTGPQGGRARITTKPDPREGPPRPPASMSFEEAAAYSDRCGGLAVLVTVDGEVVFERYAAGHGPEKANHLHSATKAFWGIVTAAMIEDGLVGGFDERAAETLEEWKDSPRKSRITLRHLLNLTAGLAQDVPNLQGLDAAAPDLYRHAVGLPVFTEPGEAFRYGPSGYYALGEIMKRKLAPRQETPLDYLKRRILDPIGVRVARWEHDLAGNPHLPNGAWLTARDWARFGLFLADRGAWEGKPIVRADLVAECFRPCEANPGHGLAIWLNRPGGRGVLSRQSAPAGARAGWIWPEGAPDLLGALGAGKNRMYVIPSTRTVVVRQSEQKRDRFSDPEFLGILFRRKPVSGAVSLESCRKAAGYSAEQRGISMLVMVDGEIVFEDYPNDGRPDRAHELASGTKSFVGVLAAAAVQDGLLAFDEKVSATLTEWKADPRKSKVTVSQLLHLTSGVRTGGERGRLPTYAEAVGLPFETEPGEAFEYGGAPFQIFGELMRRKLAKRGEGPLDYLKRRILDPIGLEIGSWRTGADGNPTLPSGARLTARNWAKLGEFVRLGGTWAGERILDRKLLDRCFEGSEANPAYGLTWWLDRDIPGEVRQRIPQLRRGLDDLRKVDGLPGDLVMAMGAGKQHLYVSRERKLVVVRQATGIRETLSGAARSSFSEATFLSLLLTGEAPAAAAGDERAEAPETAKARAEMLIRRLDRDGDGKLSPAETPSRIRDVFDRVDGNGDGVLDAAELAALLARLGGRRR